MDSENNYIELASKHGQLIKDLQQNFNDNSFADLNLICSDSISPLKCHTVLLAACSDFLKGMLTDFSNEDEVTIILPDCSRDDLEVFLHSIYGNFPRQNVQSSLLDIFKLFAVNKGAQIEEEMKSGSETVTTKSTVETLMTFDIPPSLNGSNSVEELKDMNIDDLNQTMMKGINTDKDITVLNLNCDDGNFPASTQLTCVTCLKTFTSLKKLQSHMRRVHYNKQTFKCTECDQILGSTNSLEIHMRSHSGHMPYSCGECEKHFASLHYLTQHKEFHRKSKDFECEICFKRYQNSNALSQHKVDYHSNIKYQCGMCLKLFSAKRYLKEHEKKKHSNGGSSYDCEICGKTLSGKNELKIHSRIHTGEKPFHCQECNKHFRAKSTFTIHMKSHSGTRNAVCDECGKRFIQWGDLRKHMRTHTGEKPFVCSSCDRSFARKDYLLKHEKTHNRMRYVNSKRTEKLVADKSGSEEQSLSQDNVVIDVSNLRSFVSESGENIQVVRILGGGEEDQSGYSGLSSQESVMYVITN